MNIVSFSAAGSFLSRDRRGSCLACDDQLWWYLFGYGGTMLR